MNVAISHILYCIVAQIVVLKYMVLHSPNPKYSELSVGFTSDVLVYHM